MGKKVVLVVASKGYQQDEYNDTYKVLVKAGVTVTTASDKSGTAVAMDGSTVTVDLTIEAILACHYDGTFIIGGRGAMKDGHLDTPALHRILEQAVMFGKAVGGICVAPRILAAAGILKGKKATSWDGDGLAKEVFEKADVTFVDQEVVVDGKIVTANGPQAATAFAQAILTVL